MASVKTDQSINGLRNDFEAAATHMLPYNPVQKKRVDHRTKRGPADISDATGGEAYMNVSSFGTKKGNGSSGVPLQYHKKEEDDLLNKGQKAELCEWRRGMSTEGGKKKGSNRKFDTQKAIASAAEKKVNERLKAIKQENSTKNNNTEAYMEFLAAVFPHRLTEISKLTEG